MDSQVAQASKLTPISLLQSPEVLNFHWTLSSFTSAYWAFRILSSLFTEPLVPTDPPFTPLQSFWRGGAGSLSPTYYAML